MIVFFSVHRLFRLFSSDHFTVPPGVVLADFDGPPQGWPAPAAVRTALMLLAPQGAPQQATQSVGWVQMFLRKRKPCCLPKGRQKVQRCRRVVESGDAALHAANASAAASRAQSLQGFLALL